MKGCEVKISKLGRKGLIGITLTSVHLATVYAWPTISPLDRLLSPVSSEATSIEQVISASRDSACDNDISVER